MRTGAYSRPQKMVVWKLSMLHRVILNFDRSAKQEFA
jgi:hypothetical protein